MRIESIEVKNFKNTPTATWTFKDEKGIWSQVLISGQNGLGKTTILDAIYTAFIKTSYDGNKWSDTIIPESFKTNPNSAKPVEVCVTFESDNQTHTIQRIFTHGNLGSWTCTSYLDGVKYNENVITTKLGELLHINMKHFVLYTHPLSLINPEFTSQQEAKQVFLNILSSWTKDDIEHVKHQMEQEVDKNDQPLFSKEELATLFSQDQFDPNKFDALKKNLNAEILTNDDAERRANERYQLAQEKAKTLLKNEELIQLQQRQTLLQTNLKTMTAQQQAYTKLQTSIERLNQVNHNLANQIALNNTPKPQSKVDLLKQEYMQELNAVMNSLNMFSAQVSAVAKYVDYNSALKLCDEYNQLILNFINNNATLTAYVNKENRKLLKLNAAKMEMSNKVIEYNNTTFKMFATYYYDLLASKFKTNLPSSLDTTKAINEQLQAQIEANNVQIEQATAQLGRLNYPDTSKIVQEISEISNKLGIHQTIKDEQAQALQVWRAWKQTPAAVRKSINEAKIQVLNDAKNTLIKTLTDKVNAQLKSAQISIFVEKENGVIATEFKIRDKFSKTDFKQSNEAQNWMIGLEIIELFQNHDEHHLINLPIIFDGSERLDDSNQQKILKDVQHQIILCKVSNDALSVKKLK